MVIVRALLLLLAVAILATACNDSSRFRAETEASHPRVWGVSFSGVSPTEKQREVLENCIRRQLVRWELDADTHQHRFHVEVRPDQFFCGGVEGVLACVNVQGRTIYQFVGNEEWGLLPGLYHELWHLEIGDGEHTDPRWPEWDKRALELSREFWPLWEEAGG